MKKLCISFLFLFFVCTFNLYSVSYSIGFNAVGFGYSFSKGDYYKSYIDSFSNYNGKEFSLLDRISFTDAISFNASVIFNKYFAFETGLGYNRLSSGYTYENYNGYDKITLKHSLYYLSLPLYLINRYEINNYVNFYFLFGPKFSIRLFYETEETKIVNGKSETLPVELNPDNYNMFTIYLTFALGTEYQFYKNQFFGIRVGYNLNLLGCFNKYHKTADEWRREKYFIDTLSISLTYRYVFNNK